ncbi:MAG TPA: glycosyltransferase [Candidatus Sumerlaeota bacterium]|nr:glycosyltransferase [Candidatus Sumerlaeota bacterium]
MSLPGVSIVVPVRNGEALIGDCLESLCALDYPADVREIIVVDNGSTDATASVVSRYSVRLLSEPKTGASCARNTGWRAAVHDLVAFTDSDCVVNKEWLKNLVRNFTDDALGACGGALCPAPPRTVIEEYVIHKDILSQERALRDEPISPPFIVTASAMYRRRALEDVGGFDETMTLPCEDADLAWRVGWKGWRIGYDPDAVAVHRHRATLGGLLRQIRRYGAGSALLFIRHRRRFGYNSFTIWATWRELAVSLVKTPFALILGKDRLHRVIPLLDFLGAAAFLAGKIPMSLRHGVRFF